MRILIVSDAWLPQVNGVTRTLQNTQRELEGAGHATCILSPDAFPGIPCPTYREIKLAFPLWRRLKERIEAFAPDAFHLLTEGPLGLAVRRYCVHRGIPFTSSFLTRWPEYLRARFPIPLAATYRLLRWFHGGATRTTVATESVRADLAAHGIANLVTWRKGVDTDLFRPVGPVADADLGLPRPVFLSVGRVAVEKNLEAFLSLDLPGSKVVVGDGPDKKRLERAHPDATFLGARFGEDLARCYAAADAFVFPSTTDTYGLVLLEALASGLPVAAFPVTGPNDVVGGSDVAVLDRDLRKAALAALAIPRARCREFALGRSWSAAAREFVGLLELINTTRARAV